MGTSQSIPSTLTREKVFELTRDTRGMMDIMLQYMLKELSVRDFQALSNPTECRKYVIFLANNLYKHFYELEIVPTKDKKGILAFRPVKDLVKDDVDEKQSLCLTLAYFYTRIFQIYGALALTLIDDANVMSNSGITSIVTDRTAQKGLFIPGYQRYTTSGGAISGGTIPAARELNDFFFINTFLADVDEVPQTNQGYQTLYEGEYNDEVRFKPNPPEGGKQRGVFYIGIAGAPPNEYNKLFVSTSLKTDIRGADRIFTIGDLEYYKKNRTSETVTLSSDILSNKNILIKVLPSPRTGIRRQFILITKDGEEFGKTISEYFNEVLSHVIKFIKDNRVSNTTTSPSGIIVSETGTTEELKLSRIIQNLTKTKPLGHCLARAMQLLQTQPIKERDTVSHICKAKFLEYTTVSTSGTKTQFSRSGLPEPGKQLSDSPGLAALSQLFYDTILIGTPKIIIGTKPGPGLDKKSSLESYVDFMKKMGMSFEGKDFQKSNDNIIKEGLTGIRNKRDAAICTGISGDIVVPRNQVNNIYSFVNKLYQIQIKHAAECGKIINLLFNIDRDKSSGRYTISLNSNIIKKGLPEIERINFIARDLLVKYYTNCEDTYVNGMKAVVESRRQIVAAATTTPTTTTTTTTATTATTATAATTPTPTTATAATTPRTARMPGAVATRV